MENCTPDQTESPEVTRPIPEPNDGGNSEFPMTDIGTVIDSENSEKKENHENDDKKGNIESDAHSKMTLGSEIAEDDGLVNSDEEMRSKSLEITSEIGLVSLEENMKCKLVEKSEVSEQLVGAKREVEDAPLTYVDEDDGLMKMLGKLCGRDKQRFMDEELEPYTRSPYNWKESDIEALRYKDGDEVKVENIHSAEGNRVGERLAAQGRNTVEKQFRALSPSRSAGGDASKSAYRIQNDLNPKPNYNQGVHDTLGVRQGLYQKKTENFLPEDRSGSYPNQTNVQILPPSVNRKSRSARSVDSDLYNFTHAQRGYMLAIVNDQFTRQSSREGAHWDLLKIKEVARKFGFRSLNYNKECNLSKSETLQLLTRARKMDHSECDCFLFMISTHGLEHKNAMKRGKVDHALVCADDQLIFTSTIIEMFNDENCPTLKGKPKMFFIQACRGEKLDHGGEVFVAFPRNEDKTCSVSKEGEQNRWMRESFDVSDTRHGQDSWAAGNANPNQSNSSSHPGFGEGQIAYSSSRNIPTPNSHQPSFFTPRVQQPSHIRPVSSNRPYAHRAPGELVNRIYAPTPYAIVETPSLKCDNDMLVMFAIPPGMFAWRNTSEGSWMIDYLHQVLMAYDMRRPKNFLNLLTKVSALMSRRATNTPSNPSMHGKTAVSVIEHKLDKDIVFQQKVPVSEWIKKSKTFAL